MKILQWLFGSFFRTIGRTIAILLMGGLLYYILSINGIGISDLFLDNVKASVLTENVKYSGTTYISENQNNGWTNTDGMFTQTIYTNNNEQLKSLSFSNINTSDADYIQFTFSVSQPTDVTSTNSLEGRRCLTWTCNQYCASGACAGMCEKYQCTQYGTWTEGSTTRVTDTDFLPYNLIVTANYSNSPGITNWSTCSIEGNSIFCPTLKRNILSIDFHINFRDNLNTYTSQLMVHRSITKYKYSNQEIIDNQNQNTQSIIQQQQNSTQQILDSNTTEADNTGKDFINNFSNNTHGLTGIITAPLNAIQSLSSATCTPLILPLPFTDNKTLTLPCMSSIYTQYFGAFYTMYQGIILGLISYWVCVRIFGLAKGFKDPEDDKIEVVDL